jgi:ribosome maturation factor RimP
MAFKEIVSELLEKGLAEHPSLFLIDLKIAEGNKITVTLDGDHGVTLQDCIDISRAIEHNIDRDEHDFGLDVTSAGVSSPLKLKRQYVKNIGRTLRVTTADGVTEAPLTAVNDQSITLEWEAREPKKIGKGKETVQKKLDIPYDQIKEAIVIITF